MGTELQEDRNIAAPKNPIMMIRKNDTLFMNVDVLCYDFWLQNKTVFRLECVSFSKKLKSKFYKHPIFKAELQILSQIFPHN
jgi:hypothetical protein